MRGGRGRGPWVRHDEPTGSCLFPRQRPVCVCRHPVQPGAGVDSSTAFGDQRLLRRIEGHCRLGRHHRRRGSGSTRSNSEVFAPSDEGARGPGRSSSPARSRSCHRGGRGRARRYSQPRESRRPIGLSWLRRGGPTCRRRNDVRRADEVRRPAGQVLRIYGHRLRDQVIRHLFAFATRTLMTR